MNLKKISRFLDDSKSGAFISGHTEQKFKMQPNFVIFDYVVVEKKLYYDAESEVLI